VRAAVDPPSSSARPTESAVVEADHRTSGQVEEQFDLRLQLVDHALKRMELSWARIHQVGELARVIDHVVDADVDQREFLVQERERAQLLSYRDKPERLDDLRETDVLEIGQVPKSG